MPLRVTRLAKAAAVAGLAAAPVMAIGLPAHASFTPMAEYWLRTSHITQAWRTDQGAGVIVAVLADGVDAGRPDISGSVIVGPDYTGSGRRPGGRYYGVVGTGLASLIVGHGHAKHQGVLGVAEAAKVLSVRVTLSPGDPLWAHSRITSRLPAAIAAGIRYAVKHGASVIDLPADPGLTGLTIAAGTRGSHPRANRPGGSGPSGSGVSPGDTVHPRASTVDPAERSAVAYAVGKGVVLVAPAGDNARSGDAAAYPAAFPGVMAVGSSGKDLGLAPYSNRHPYVALTAAGQHVIAASPTGYQTMNGTWAASAIVAGVATLVRSEFPALTAAQVRNAMIDGAAPGRPGGSSAGAAHRTVDAEGAIAKAMTMSPPDANLAMKGALPRISPATPPEPSLGSGILADLVRDGVISLAALVAMLVPITWYGSVARRRDRLVLAAELERQERARPEHGTMLADPLLEYFAPQPVRPADRPPQPRSTPSPRFQPTSSLIGRPVLVQTSRAARLGLPASPSLPPSASLPPSPASPSLPPSASLSGPPSDTWGTQASDRQANTGQANTGQATTRQANNERADNGGATAGSAFSPARESAGSPGHGDARNGPEPTVRQASVTGSPPWEPAPQPTTALPWAPQPPAAQPPVPSGTAPSAAAPSGTTPSGATRGDRPARLSMPPRSLFDPSPVMHLSAPTMETRDTSERGSRGTSERGSRGTPAGGSRGTPEGGASAQDSGSRPIYVWNPSSTGALGENHDDKSGWLSIGHDSDLPACRAADSPGLPDDRSPGLPDDRGHCAMAHAA